jgi:hypothetical protein
MELLVNEGLMVKLPAGDDAGGKLNWPLGLLWSPKGVCSAFEAPSEIEAGVASCSVAERELKLGLLVLAVALAKEDVAEAESKVFEVDQAGSEELAGPEASVDVGLSANGLGVPPCVSPPLGPALKWLFARLVENGLVIGCDDPLNEFLGVLSSAGFEKLAIELFESVDGWFDAELKELMAELFGG